ncbi:MAG TPA: hypothetical protein VML55_25600 [Planctomycetaceae bacterium]|nr:hypothetical protein [Planctomycetaceae bacterium]
MSARVSLAEAASRLAELVDRINRDQITLDLEKDERVVARLSPAHEAPRMPVAKLAEFFARLPRLGEDAERFAEDVSRIRREMPAVADPWA